MAPILLPLDILHVVFTHLSISDILHVRLVCKHFLYATKTRTTWSSYIQSRLISTHTPVPGLHNRSLCDFSPMTLERLAITAERYKSNWHAEDPVPVRRRDFVAVPRNPNSRIIAVKFWKRDGKDWLFTIAMTRSSTNGMRVHTFQCWDLDPHSEYREEESADKGANNSAPVCIARRVFHHFGGMTFNRVQGARLVAAVKDPEIRLIGIDPAVGKPPQQACVTLAQIDDRPAGKVFLVGDHIISQDERKRTFWYHFERPKERIELVGNDGNAQEEMLDVFMDHNWIILARTRSLELYTLPERLCRGVQIRPLVKHRWHWIVDTLILSCPTTEHSSRSIKPIHIALRFGTIHPWPVNTIHRFELQPNPDFSFPLSKSSLPYIFPPANMQSFSSTVRLMATYDMAVGSRGTIVHLDSQVEELLGQSDLGQRLAGRRISMPSSAKDKAKDEETKKGRLKNEKMDTEGQAGKSGDSKVSTMSVYAVTQREEWTRVDVQEEEGKIALGYVDGRVTIFEYA